MDAAPTPPKPDPSDPLIGETIAGRYLIEVRLGEGAMGSVYRARHVKVGRPFAVKVLHPELLSDKKVMQRFEREALAVSRLNHPNTVQVFDFGSVEGALYLIMEHVRGQDLARVVERDGALPFARAAPLFVQICGALQEAHELGIVHRDLKPENVLVTRSTGGRDFAKVLDFGLVKLSTREAAPDMTDRAQIVGTPYFMSPEQIRGEEVDARTDIYSLGALMFELLTGTHLYSGSTAVGVLTKHLTTEPDAPSMRAPKQGIPPEVDAIVRKALAKDPDARWQTASQLAEAIDEVYAETVESTGVKKLSRGLGGGAIAEDLASESDLRLRRSDIDSYESSLKRRRWLVLAMMALLVGGAAAGAVWYLTQPVPPLTAEREGNDDPELANRIEAGKPVTGYLGKRRSTTEGDRDVYRIE